MGPKQNEARDQTEVPRDTVCTRTRPDNASLGALVFRLGIPKEDMAEGMPLHPYKACSLNVLMLFCVTAVSGVLLPGGQNSPCSAKADSALKHPYNPTDISLCRSCSGRMRACFQLGKKGKKHEESSRTGVGLAPGLHPFPGRLWEQRDRLRSLQEGTQRGHQRGEKEAGAKRRSRGLTNDGKTTRL